MRASVGVVVPLRSTTSVLHGQSNKHLSLAEKEEEWEKVSIVLGKGGAERL